MAAPFRFGSVQAALSGIDDGQLLNFEHIAECTVLASKT
jgi:hypothetical protein